MGKLYVVGTPIGNLEDISSRALKTLKEVDLILCEDTRVTRKLLSHYDIDTPTLSYHQHSSESRKEKVLNKILQGVSLALVVDAGTPGVSDPGNELIDYLQKRFSEIEVIPIAGPSSVAAILSVCGFNASKYVFGGYFPKKNKTRWIKRIFGLNVTVVYFDSPYRVVKNLCFLRDNLKGVGRVCVGRELTKMYEKIYRGSVEEVISGLGEGKIKGEVVVAVDYE